MVAIAVPKMEVLRSSKYLRWVAEHHCLSCYAPPPAVIAHHVRYLGKSGVGIKVGDNFTVPLCVECHNGLHSHKEGERSWWHYYLFSDPEDFINSKEATDERRKLEQENA